MKKIAIIAAAAALPLSACAGIQGPPQVISQTGVLPQPVGGTWEERFAAAAQVAFSDNSTDADRKLFLRSGTMLVYTRCSDFFQRMGRNQGRSRVTRDYIAPVVTLLTGIVSLHDFGIDSDKEQNILEALTLGSSFATSALDIHDRHFLFGADNIDSVREMTLNSLSKHRVTVMERDLDSLDDAVEHLVDNQTICTPPHILRLARQAIANSKPQTVNTEGDETGSQRVHDHSRPMAPAAPTPTSTSTSTTTTTSTSTDSNEKGRVGVRIPN
ncbi:MAG TPA: hypothetical protein VF650_14455 [Allosphingosinicella sp.]|jgi:hypothetical protein